MRSYRGLLVSAVGIIFSTAFSGCGGNTSSCKITAINVSPTTATVSHTAPSPGNTQHFAAFAASSTNGCAIQQSNLTSVIWSVSDQVNVSISNTQDATFGTATCNGATAGAISVKATLSQTDFAPVTSTASLTCN